jgi:hypothetical protein
MFFGKKFFLKYAPDLNCFKIRCFWGYFKSNAFAPFASKRNLEKIAARNLIAQIFRNTKGNDPIPKGERRFWNNFYKNWIRVKSRSILC